MSRWPSTDMGGSHSSQLRSGETAYSGIPAPQIQ